MRDGDCPQTSAKIRLSVAIYKPGCWVPLAATTGTRTGVSEEDRGCESPGGGQPRPPDQLWGCGTDQQRLETSKPSSLESKNKRLVCTKLLQLWGQNQTQEKGGGKRKCGSKNSILFLPSHPHPTPGNPQYTLPLSFPQQRYNQKKISFGGQE